jgi:hypothetical protein
MIFSIVVLLMAMIGITLMVIEVQCQNEINKIRDYESQGINSDFANFRS